MYYAIVISVPIFIVRIYTVLPPVFVNKDTAMLLAGIYSIGFLHGQASQGNKEKRTFFSVNQKLGKHSHI